MPGSTLPQPEAPCQPDGITPPTFRQEEGCAIELLERDGGTAWIARPCRLVLVAESDIGWALWLDAPNESPAERSTYDQLFEDVLATVQLHAAPAGR